MRVSKKLPALASGFAVAALLASATASDAAANPAPACTTWQAVATPPGPPSIAGLVNGAGVDALSPHDVWFPAMTAGGDSWTFHWDGHAFQVPAQLPPTPPGVFRGLDGASFDSTADGWMLYGYSYKQDLNVLAVGASDLIPTIAARWHDGRWTVTPMAVSQDPQEAADPVTVAALSADDAWAVGSLNPSTGPAAGALTEHWDGTQWNLVPNAASGQQGASLKAMTVVSRTDIWAVGEQDNSTGTGIVPLVEHWDGRNWTIVPAPPGTSDSSLTSISADGPGDIWATGVQGPAASSTPLVEHWDGSTWEIAAGLPNVGTTSGASVLNSGPAPDDVYAASPDDVWVTFQPESEIGGFFGGVGTPGSFLHWDGSTWTTVPVPAPREFGMVYDLMGISGSGPGDIWAVGDVYEQGDSGAVLPFIEQVYQLACR